MIVAANEVRQFPYMNETNWSSGSSTVNFNGASVSIAVVCRIPFTGSLSTIHYRINGVTSPVLTLRIELRTVDATTGLPNAAGTLYGSSSSVTVSNPSAGNKTASVNCTGATIGDLVALVFDLSAYTSGSFTLLQRWSGPITGASVQAFPYAVLNNVVQALTFNCFALEYSGTYYPLSWNTCVVQAATTQTVSNSGVTRVGNRIRSSVPRRACGMWVWGDMDGDFLFRLRLASDDSILATATVDKDVRGLTSAGYTEVIFDAGATYNLVAGVDYYALVEGNSATTCSVSLLSGIVANGQMDQLAGGKNCYGTSYNSGYSDVNTSRYTVGILYDGLDNGLWPAIGAAG